MKQISIRISDIEDKHLKRFCQLTERTQSEVIREIVRRLSISGILNPIDTLGESMYPVADSANTARGL